MCYVIGLGFGHIYKNTFSFNNTVNRLSTIAKTHFNLFQMKILSSIRSTNTFEKYTDLIVISVIITLYTVTFDNILVILRSNHDK